MLEGVIKARVKVGETIRIRDIYAGHEVDHGWFRVKSLTDTEVYLEPVQEPDFD